MNTKMVKVLSVQEARELLVGFFAQFLRESDEVSLKEFLREGNHFIPDIPQMSDNEVIEKVGELDIAVQVGLTEDGTDLVLVQTADYIYEAIFDKQNVPPRERKGGSDVAPAEGQSEAA